MKDFFDLQKPFYRPLWIRVLIVGFCLGWALMELAQGAPFWTILFGAVGLYAAHQFFIAFDPKEPDPPADEDRP
ncbi:hypothetical protein [Paracoccus tegillarcae]|uniref:DUF3329 domain-containing protein n=1 Tax=Paracoccus tegillarcae TaxID=1529068 RepID=A0A2K9EDM0_9RHOB|nr:hypothetical protein [Paracoccus tegillarcae]AUH33030.1 hypothetical protein CUV01_06155 [Paracoccus tegillarcae]